ncbi:MAG: hypothetical protein K6T75_03010 [Acetobacteraceae bacterium]|nr:hypothetical protein [Acetobacteraceae bacterium]
MAEKACPYWRDYDSVQGRVCFCALAAFARHPSPAELKALGCTRERRTQCFNTMKAVMGAGCVPGDVETAPAAGLTPAAASGGDAAACGGRRASTRAG